MSGIRATSTLGTAARWARRAGLGHLLRAGIDLTDRALLRADLPPLAAEIDGVDLRGYLRHRGFLDYVRRGMPEERFYRRLLVDTIDSRTTFVDAGAHIGAYTLLAARRARRVISFEPDPYNLAALRSNVAASGCENVEIQAQAVADRTARASFRSFRSTFSGSLLPREVDEYREFEIETVALDDVLNDPDLGRLVVKLDVEGAEPLALAGMRRTVRDAPNLVLFIEVNPAALAAGNWNAGTITEELRGACIDCAFVDESRSALVTHQADEPAPKGNLLCSRGVTNGTGFLVVPARLSGERGPSRE